MDYKSTVTALLKQADIDINGTRPQDITVHDNRFYRLFLSNGRLGMGESYMDGWWDCEKLDEMFLHLFRSSLKIQRQAKSLRFALMLLKAKLMPENSLTRAREVVDIHYDLGNDVFESTLDKHMIYTCPVWKDAATLEDAQEAKMDLICRKLQIKPGMRVLDVGSGWGGLSKFIAKNYGAKVTGISISKEQNDWARKNCAGLDVNIEFLDYRDLDPQKHGIFDRMVCLEMVEHVGVKYYHTYFKTLAACLAPDGLFLMQANTLNDAPYFNPWLTKYIFPGGYVPSVSEIAKEMEKVFFIENLHNIGIDYYRTFLVWNENFERNWPKLRDKYGDRFFRMWRYYLLSCAAGYKARKIQVYQYVLAKESRAEAYVAIA